MYLDNYAGQCGLLGFLEGGGEGGVEARLSHFITQKR